MPGKEVIPRPPAPLPVFPEHPPWSQQKPQSEAAIRTISRWWYRNRHLTAPATIPAALLGAAAGLHAAGGYGVLAVGIAGAILTGAVVFFGRSHWDREKERWYAIASASAFSLWLFTATLVGPFSGFVTFCVLGALLLAGAIAWGIPWYRHKRPRGHRRKQKQVAKWDAWWQSHCWNWNLGGSRVVDVWEMGVTTKLLIQGIPGRHSIQHVNQVMHLIESGADEHAGIGMIRSEAVKKKPSQFYLFLKRENPLREIVDYDLSLAPRSVHDPMPDGLTETGAWKMTTLRVNSFINGASRTGKSNRLLVRVAAISGCPDGRSVIIDLKGGRSARPVLKAAAAEYVITDIDEARMYLKMLAAEIRARAMYAYTEEEQLHATGEVPSLHTFIDETHGLTSVMNGDAECARLLATVASQGMGLEVYVEVYTQYGSLDESVRTEQTRFNLPLRVVYRVEQASHGAYCIPEYNRLDASKLEEKGSCYIKDGPEALPEQVRTPNMPHKLFPRIASQNAALIGTRRPLMLYCGNQAAYGDMTWQQWWDSRWDRLDPAFRDDSPQYKEWAALRSAPSPAAAFAARQGIREDAVPPEAVPAEPGQGDGRAAQARIDTELADAHRGNPGNVPSPKVNLAAEIARKKDIFAATLESAPQAGVSPTQVIKESGMSPSWTYQMIKTLVGLGSLTQLGRGRYAPMPGEDIREAVSAIEVGNEQLYREGRARVNAA